MTKIPKQIQPYIDIVEGGEVRVCNEQKLLIALVKRIFETEDLVYDDEQIEKYLSYQKYFPFDLFEWEVFVFVLHCCVFKVDGTPRFPELLVLIGRGGGKNALLAFIDFCLVTPTNGISEYHIDICANSEEQAKTTFKDLKNILENPKFIKKFRKFFKWNDTQIENLNTRSIIKYRTNNPKGKDGLRSGKVDFDEPHAYENWENINVFTTGLGKKAAPRKTFISTDGDVREGPLDQLKEKSESILNGELPDNGFLPFICKLDNEAEVHDPANWDKANPSLRYLPILLNEMKREYTDYLIDPVIHHAFMTKRMNIPQGRKDTEVATWENILKTNGELPDLKNKRCICGIDFSKTTDFVSAFLLFKDRDMYYGIHHSWFCSNSNDKHRIKPLEEFKKLDVLTVVNDVEIHPSYVVDWIKEQKKLYRIDKIAVDSYRYSLLSKELREAGYDANNKEVKLVRPSDIMLVQPKVNSVFLNNKIIWGDDPMMRWFTNNTKLEPAPNNNFKYGKIEAKSRKTDGFMAFVAAMTLEEELPEVQEHVFFEPIIF